MRINPITSHFNIKRQQNVHNQTQVMPKLNMLEKDIFVLSTSPVSSVSPVNFSNVNFKGRQKLKDDIDLLSACNDDSISIETFKKILEQPNINVNRKRQDIGKDAPLHILCKDKSEQSLEKLKELLKHPNININLQNEFHNTPLHDVCRNHSESSVEKLKELLKQENIDINIQGNDNNTALHYVCCVKTKADVEKFKELIKLPKIKMNIQNWGDATPLHILCEFATLNRDTEEGCLEMLKELLKNPDVNVNLQGNAGNTPLHHVCKNIVFYSERHVKMLKELLKRPDINVNLLNKCGQAPLHILCDENSGETVESLKELLKNKNINVNLKTNERESALHLLCKDKSEQSLEKLKELLKHPNIDVNLREEYGHTPLHDFCNSSSEMSLDMVKELLKHPDIDINLKNNCGETALHLACEKGNLEKVKEILKHPDVDITIKNDEGKTALDVCQDSWSMSRAREEIIKLLKEYKRGEDNRYLIYKSKKSPTLKSMIEIDKLTPEKNIWTKEEISKHFLKLIDNEDFDNAILMLSRTPLIDLEADDNKILKRVAKTGKSDFIKKVDEYKDNQADMLKDYEAKRKAFLEQTLPTFSYKQLKTNPVIITPEGFSVLMDKEEFNPNDKHSFYGREITFFEQACLLDPEGNFARQIFSSFCNVDTKISDFVSRKMNENLFTIIDEYNNFSKLEFKLMEPDTQEEALKEIEAFIDSDKYNPEKIDSLHNNFLHIISQIPSQKRIIKKLIDKNTNINHKNVAGETPIMSAIKMLSITDDPNDRAGLVENISYMADNGADINAQDNKQDSVWHYVCRASSQALLNLVWNKGIIIMLKNAKGEIGANLITDEAVKNLYKQCLTKLSI